MARLGGAANAKVGVMTAIEVQTPLASTGSNNGSLVSMDSAATWALILFLVATILLFFII